MKCENFSQKNGMCVVDGPFRVGDSPELFVSVLREKKKLRDETIAKMATVFRDIYGHGEPVDQSSWGEYLRCPNCASSQSIEDFFELREYRSIADLENGDSLPDVNCSDCGEKMEFFWDPKLLREKIRKQFNEKEVFFAAIHDEPENIYGLQYGWLDTIQNAWEETIAGLYSESDLDYEQYSKQMANSQFEFREDDQVLHSAEIGIQIPFRAAFYHLLGSWLNNAVPPKMIQNFPGITATHDEVGASKILKKVGWEVSCSTDYSSIVVFCGDWRPMTEASKSKDAREFLRHFRSTK